MRTLEELFIEFPPYYASQAAPRRGSWFFMLWDGRVVGGTEFINHYKMMGVTDGEAVHSAKKDFVVNNKLLRVAAGTGTDGSGSVYVEFYEAMLPNDVQIVALATLAKIFNDGPITWDMWLTNPIKDSHWLHGEGNINRFRRFLENPSAKLRRHMKRFNIVFRFTDRTTGPKEIPAKVEASTLPVGLAKAGREFWKGLDRKARFDALKDGVSIAVTVSE